MTQVNTESNQVQGALGDAVSVEAGQHSRDVSHHESPQLVGSPPHSSVNHQEQIADADHSHPEGNGAKKNPFGRQLNPSWKVVFNIDNAMVGTALLVLPLHFQWAGFIVSFIAAVIGTTIAFVTTHLVVIHHKKRRERYESATLKNHWARLGERLPVERVHHAIWLWCFVLPFDYQYRIYHG